MKFDKFEDMLVWQKAKNLSKKIYKEFENSKDWGFKEQIQRAAVSIMNNIAKGYERSSNNEFKHFLFIAKGSCGETRSMLHLAKDLEKTFYRNIRKTHSRQRRNLENALWTN